MVRLEWESWVPDNIQMRTKINQYMQAINIYWMLKFLLEKVIMDSEEARKDMLKNMDHIHGDLNHNDCITDMMDR